MRESNKKIAKNSLYLYIRTFISILVTFYTSRVFLELLGIEDFGIYNIVGGVIAFFSVLRNLLAGSIQRFLNVEIGANNKEQENKYLDISIVINFLIILLFVITAETIGLWLVNTQLNIPLGKESITVYAYQLSVLTVAVSMIAVPYTAYIISHERMEFYAWITIVEVLSKLTITLLLSFFANRLIVFCWLFLAMTSTITLLYYIYCRCRIGMSAFRFYSPKVNNEYKKVLSFSLWTVLGNGATVFRDQGISFVFNIFYGVILNAALGVVTQISNVYTSLFSNVQTAFMPQIVQSANTDSIRFKTLLRYCVLLTFLLMSFVCLPMIANADYILHLWLGDNVPVFSALFVQVFMLKILIVSSSQAVYRSLVAVGKIKENQIWMSILSIMTVLSSYIALSLSVSPVIAIMFVVLMDTFMFGIQLHYMARYTSVKMKDVIDVLYKPFFVVFVVLVPFSFWFSTIEVSPFLKLLVSTTIITMINMTLCYYSLEASTRQIFISYINNIILKR